MATGSFGTVRPADIRPSDAEIFVHFTEKRSSMGEANLTRYGGDELLIKTTYPIGDELNGTLFGGLYTLKLPAANFSQKGFYTIIIKPIEIRAKILDCGVLDSATNSLTTKAKGLVFDINQVSDEFKNYFANNGLIGYRIEYLDPTAIGDKKINNFFRIITSNNLVEPVNTTDSNIQSTRYAFNDTSSLSFCTVSPSSSSNVKPDAIPIIGESGQDIIITNTFFNPIMIEVEMVEHDIETLAYALMANQTKSLEDGIYTIYNFERDIYKQYNIFEIKQEFNGLPLFEVREERTNIDFTKKFDDIINV